MGLMGVPITLVTGFLGAGKTTLINQVLKETKVPADQIAIIVNEFGEVGIDHQLLLQSEEKVYQLNNGCICCTLRTDLAATLGSLVEYFEENNQPLSHVIIETTGISDPAPIIQTLVLAPNLANIFFIDAVVTVVDCQNFEMILEQHHEVFQQISYADRFILTKTESLSESEIAHIKSELKTLNPLADFMAYALEEGYPESEFFNLAKFHGIKEPDVVEEEEECPHCHGHHHGEECHHHHDEGKCSDPDCDCHHHHGEEECSDPNCHCHHHHHEVDHHGFVSMVLTTDEAINESLFLKWLDWVLMNYNGKLYRYKGLLKLIDRDMMVALQGVNVGYRFDMTTYLAEETPTQLVLIGKELEEKLIRQSFLELIQMSQNQ